MIALHWTVPSALPADHRAELAILSTDEIDRRRRLRRDADQRRFLAAWALTRRVLGELTGATPAALRFTRLCRQCGDPRHGKPRLAGGGPDFNLSHSGDLVLLAVTDRGEVGVDVEQCTRSLADLRRFILHPQESAEDADLLRVWVRKEAMLKATGDGLVTPMAGFRHDPPPDGIIVRDIEAADGYVAAYAWYDGATEADFGHR